MKLRTPIVLALTLTFVTLVEPAPVASEPRIINAEGQVWLKRGTSNYRLTGVDEELMYGDRLKTEQGTKVLVLCDDLTLWRVPDGGIWSLYNGCPIIVARKKRGETRSRPGGSDPQIPYPLGPRMTYLLNDKPTFRWNGVKGASRYTVQLKGPGGAEWSAPAEVSATELVYPEDEPPLKWGVKYLLIVEADNNTSSRYDCGANLGFELLPEYKVQKVQEEAAKIDDLPDLTEEEKSLALAELYSNESLIADAIKTLEMLAERGSQTTSVYLRLGDLYGEAGLNLLAEARYSKAIDLFTATQDRYGLTKAQAGLAQVKLRLEEVCKENPPSLDQILTPRG